MFFTYDSYFQMLNLLRESGYAFSSYADYTNVSRPVVLRHDVDFSLEKAHTMALLENENNVKATYFILVSTDFYNVFSKRSSSTLRRISDLGHYIGLHFDEMAYSDSEIYDLEGPIQSEIAVLEHIIGSKVHAVSMHRPSKDMLGADMKIEGVINTYSRVFFHKFKYLSDSRMFFQEDICGTIRTQRYRQLHILTHPFWYSPTQISMKDKLLDFIGNASKERYRSLNDNFTNLESVICPERLN